MAKSKKTPAASTPAESDLALHYTLVELPSSQHRAGLVGLVLLVRYMKAAGTSDADACVESIAAGEVTLRFTRRGMQALFDTAFNATLGEIESDKIYKNKKKEEVPPVRSETRTVRDKSGKEKQRTVYIYNKPIPKGAFIEQIDRDGPWLKMWRDMLWSIPRGVPATRKPFEARAEGESASDGTEMFELLSAAPSKSVPLASTYLLGAQAVTADNVPFADAARFQFLLHFWPYATEPFVPAFATRDGKSEFDGYAFVFPDVACLDEYCDNYLDFLRSRDGALRAYLPRAAVVDLPAEAGLRAMDWMGRVLQTRAQQGRTTGLEDLVLGVDVVHARKDGNNVRILSTSRVVPRIVASDAYQKLISGDYWSSVFRRQLLSNLLEDAPWYDGFAVLFATLPSELTFKNSAFQHDARNAFQERANTMEEQSNLPKLVFRITTHYLMGVLRSKYQLKWEEEKGNPKKWNDHKEKVAREALLAMRSRTGDDFVAYVTTTVFSVGQGLREEEYLQISHALLGETETFRTLLMLAFSAQMPWSPRSENEGKKEGFAS